MACSCVFGSGCAYDGCANSVALLPRLNETRAGPAGSMTVLLCVMQANVDFSTAAAIRLAKAHDPERDRTMASAGGWVGGGGGWGAAREGGR
jgi:hypothetical protein